MYHGRKLKELGAETEKGQKNTRITILCESLFIGYSFESNMCNARMSHAMCLLLKNMKNCVQNKLLLEENNMQKFNFCIYAHSM